jgi:hypothetical protein
MNLEATVSLIDEPRDTPFKKYIGNSTVETNNSGSKKSRNLQVISGLGCPRRSKLSIHNEKFQMSAEIP